MRFSIVPAILALSLAAPAQAANGASALSLSPSIRAGEPMIEDATLASSLPIGTWISIGLALVGAYLSIDALSDDEPVSA
ncbi:hypothetical protein IC614_00515 [Allosphingosinicella flava]|uniref:Uncharacterized protein n=1 Tax=Allosphingosinicella flava TaxID=2771430 RepID=A0A7T2GKE7_9SPHN|nr:hypothetical protein [Sphingosinicella flava]QPQ55143.1 hypothetical protein IC614_00515 [Sphingosinicella flava]